ncbi:MAG: family 78 glycoside hydrolase catalytic domain [Prevotella sp.]|nr:family 78 glycoside hydrolase catalytic domain [Prevotella sp.]
MKRILSLFTVLPFYRFTLLPFYRFTLLPLYLFTFLPLNAQSPFEGAQWIGAITKEDARIPEGRNYNGATLKQPEVKAAWAAVDSLSRRSICIVRQFKTRKNIRRASVSIVGLGFYELQLNGRKVGDAEFAPLWSDYDKTVFYNTYDVTDWLRSGRNDISVLLGNGFYNEQGGRYHKLKISFGPPTLLFALDIAYQDGRTQRLVSDGAWQWMPSPITFNSLYGGEDYDGRASYGTPEGGKLLKPVVIQTAPRGELVRQIAEPVKIIERFSPADTIRRSDSLLVLDMGQNLAGFPEITVSGQRGQRVKLTVSETLTPDSLCNQRQTGRPHYYTYTLRGDGKEETWHPRFAYYGFRYIQVEGDVSALRAIRSCFVSNSARRTGSFECSNALINQTHRLIDRAIRSNWQAVWTDCPHREKLGWLEQDWLNGEALTYNYDCRSFLEQTMRNISDAQHADGSMPETAPEYTVFEGSWAPPFLESPEWGGALIALPFLYYEHYGDDRLIRQHYEAMVRYADYLSTQDSCYILRQGLGDWYDYGPWRAGFARNTPMPLASTAHYYRWTQLMVSAAGIMQRPADAVRFAVRADSIRHAFNREFLDPATGRYASGSQAAQAIALELQLVPQKLRKRALQLLIDDIHSHNDRLTTGDVGNRYLFGALVNNGQRELLYRMLNHYDVPGYGYQIRQGHTTLTEQWNPENGASMNHFMMGHVENLLIPDLLGIQLNGRHIRIAPHPVGDLTWCRGAAQSLSGEVKAAWRIDAQTLTLDVDIPEGASAVVILPFSHRRLSVGSGHHTLTDQRPTP